jgi:hypothetical protein
LLSGAQAHTLAVPPPPQVLGNAQVNARAAAQSVTVRLAPQLSVPVTVPQSLRRRVQNAEFVSGVQAAWPQTLATPPPPQVLGEVHGSARATAQSATVRLAPQRSVAVTVPQFLPSRVQKAASVSVHAQTFEVHALGAAHVTPRAAPQSTDRAEPQLSVAVTVPQFLPSREQ